jgi:molybdopterin synthase catalytic subunit
MSVEVQLIDGPLAAQAAAWRPAGAGAVLCFEGIVRPAEADRAIVALDYQVYEPMASKLLGRIGEELVGRHGLLALRVEHSRGRIAVGECSLRLQIASRHREEGLAAMAEFIDRLKRDVPIWKTPIWHSDRATMR